MFCDINKAFDMSWYDGLIYQLKRSGTSVPLLSSFFLYLQGLWSLRRHLYNSIGIWIPIINPWWSSGRLKLTIGIIIPVRRYLFSGLRPRLLLFVIYKNDITDGGGGGYPWSVIFVDHTSLVIDIDNSKSHFKLHITIWKCMLWDNGVACHTVHLQTIPRFMLF